MNEEFDLEDATTIMHNDVLFAFKWGRPVTPWKYTDYTGGEAIEKEQMEELPCS